MDTSREISIPEVAQRLGCTIPHAQALVRSGRILGRKTTRGWVTTTAAVAKYLATHSVTNASREV